MDWCMRFFGTATPTASWICTCSYLPDFIIPKRRVSMGRETSSGLRTGIRSSGSGNDPRASHVGEQLIDINPLHLDPVIRAVHGTNIFTHRPWNHLAM